MKSLFLPVALAGVLSGCVAVPYDDSYPVYSDQVYYGQGTYEVPPPYAVTPYPVQPGYVGPPVGFGFGLNYWGGGGGGRGFQGHPHPHPHPGLQPHPPRGFRPSWGGPPRMGPRR